MTTHLRKDKSATPCVRRMAAKQLSKALKALEADDQAHGDEAVHDARKCLKKARAYLRLLRPALGSRVYRRENAAIRDAAQPLTEIRDARILLEALDKLGEHAGAVLDSATMAAVRRLLINHQAQVRQRMQSGGTLDAVRKSLKKIRSRAKRWRVGRRGWSVMGLGVRRVYQAGRDAFDLAQFDPTVENLHEWRKQAKYLWHALEILQPLWPLALDELTAQANSVADNLGDNHDLAVLHQKMAELNCELPDVAALAALLAAIDRRRKDLEEQAYSLGRRLYRETPRALAARLKRYWDVWRSEKPAAMQ